MTSRKEEVENLVPSFVACLAPIISRYREMVQTDENVVKHFAQRLDEERARYNRKFASMRTNSDYAGLESTIDDVEKSVNTHADIEIARSKADGKVEFERKSNG